MFNTKNILIGLVLLLMVAMVAIIYRMFFQFDQKEIKIYVNDEADKYEDKQAAYDIIMDSVRNILSSYSSTNQVLTIAKANNTDKEQELVHAAIMQARSLSYLSI